MAAVLKLTRGTNYLDLTSGRYAADFTPPRGMGGYSFDVRIMGSSMAEVQRGKKDIEDFLYKPEDPAAPLYLEWRPDSNVSAEPVWGQFGATKKAPLYGECFVDWWDEYEATQYTSRGGRVIVTCTLGIIEGARQLLANAKGGVCEDWIGTTDGTSRGVQIPEADATNGNKSLNPIFGHGTWNNGWTAGSGITAVQNTDPQFILWGLNSAKLSTASATVADNLYTEVINPGNTNKHTHTIYAKLQDSGTISSTQVVLYFNGAAQTTTYTAMGDGWYRLGCANFDGVNAATCDCGVQVKQNYTVYITGHQLEERTYASPFFYGDMLGCHWNGTAHASLSHRDAASMRMNQQLKDIGSLRIIWKADRASTTYTANGTIFSDATNISLYYDYASGNWKFYHSVGNFIDVADTFAAGEIIVFHIVWNGTNAIVYINGASAGSAAYIIPFPATYLYIGSISTATVQIGGTFMGFTVGNSMSASEVLADYNNIAALIADGQPVDPIPYLWSASADGVVQNADDGTNQNWAVVAGVQGDIPATVEAKLVTSTSSDDVYIGNLDFEYRKFIDPEFMTYYSSTADEVSINTADTTLATISLDNDEFEMIKGRYISLMLRCDEDATGNNLVWRTGISPGGAYYYTPYEASSWIASASNEMSIDLSPQIALPGDEKMFNLLGINRAVAARATAYRTASGALTIRVESAQIVPYPMTRFANVSAGSATGILYVNDHAYEIDSSSNLYYSYQIRGDPLQLIPGRYNLLVSYVGREAIESTGAATLTYSSVYVTPRWSSM